MENFIFPHEKANTAMPTEDGKKRDVSLFPGNYAFVQDGSKGNIKVYSGPTVITLSGQDIPVVYDQSLRTFRPVGNLEAAVQISAVAVQGYYIELLNPAKDNNHPSDGQSQNGADLIVGRKINIPGPTMFPLWPGQVANIIKGHHLKSNEYLLCRVYDEDEARLNWGKAIVKSAMSKLVPPTEGATEEEKKAYEVARTEEKKTLASVAKPPPDLSVGKLFIIPGTEVSFFIPPTGITVVENEESEAGDDSRYVRNALTLERLEFAVLVDENGRKRYEIGPAVVFPRPTERFTQDKESGSKKFSAYELNEIQGLHIKVIADYEESGKKYKAGDELFLTGKDTAIYYPREEHALVRYDGKIKHYATAIPAGEARYILNRMTGDITMAKGPAMLLPDPRKEIIVRRALSAKQCELWYPGNKEVQDINSELRKLAGNAPTTRSGTVSEGEIERSGSKSLRSRGEERLTKGSTFAGVAATSFDAMDLQRSVSNYSTQNSNVGKPQNYVPGDEFTRQSTYNQPRSITLGDKYQGVPMVDLWNGYAVMVVSKTGKRRVMAGPTTILLDYDESLEVMELSTGKPKNTDNLIRTVYLRTENNKISDLVTIETEDHVEVVLKLSYLVNFDGDKERWFSVENYVKFLCDHTRSVLKGALQRIKIEDFYKSPTDIIRGIILGESKGGMLFEENSMEVSDIEVLGIEIKDSEIREMLAESQVSVVRSNIEMARLRRSLVTTEETETIQRREELIRAETTKQRNDLGRELEASHLTLALERLANALKETEEQKKVDAEKQSISKQATTARLELEKLSTDQLLSADAQKQKMRIEELVASTEDAIKRFGAVEGNFTSALTTLGNNEVLEKLAKAWSFQSIVGGENITDALSKVFAGTPLAAIIGKLTSGNGIVIEPKKDQHGQQPRVL